MSTRPMMSRLLTTFVAGACTIGASAMGACTRGAASAADSVEDAVVVSLSRGPCRGFCPEYRVDLHGSGKVVFEGGRNTQGGTHGATVSPEAVRALVQAIDASGFASADTAYVYGSASCGQYYADLPVVTVTAGIGARRKTVQHDPGCQGAPAFLRALESRIDSVAGTARWITEKGD